MHIWATGHAVLLRNGQVFNVIRSGIASKASGAMGDLTRCSEDVMLGNTAKYARLGLSLHHTAVVSHLNARILDT